MPRVTVHEARRDLVERFVHFADEADVDTAERFLSNAEASFALLSTQPPMGAPLTLRHPELQGVRKWRVDGFENVLIFYRPRPGGIAIVRALHSSQDWWGTLAMQP